MSIESKGTKDSESSPFFKNHEKMAKSWESLSREFNGEIRGTFNGYYINFKLKIPLKELILSVEGKRELGSVDGGALPVNSRYSEQTTFKISPLEANGLKLKIKRVNIISMLNPWINKLKHNPKYRISTNHTPIANKIEGIYDWENEENLYVYRFDSKSKVLIIKYFKFFNDISEMKKMILHIQSVSQIIKTNMRLTMSTSHPR